MKGYMYILLCSNGQYYTGSTNNVERRLAQHREGEGSNFTKKHLPVKLVYLEEYDSIEDAFFREKQVQGWRRKKKEALINEFMRRYKDYRKSKGLKVGDLVTLYLKIEDSLTKKIFEEFIKNNFSVFNAKSVVINEVEEVDIEIEVMDTKIGVSIN